MNRFSSVSKSKKINIKRIALLGLLFALAVVLSVLENLIPIPIPVPGIRLGLSNIVIMFALFNLNKRDALTLALMKSTFVLTTRGPIAAIMSLSGGLCALTIMILVVLIFKNRSTYLSVSVAGAVFHNIGQITAASVIMQTFLWPYLPLLLISGLVTGIATSILLKLTSSAFKRLHLK